MPTFDREAYRLAEEETARALPMDAGHPWVFAWHPTAYEVVEVGGKLRWAPRLRAIKLIKGANGIRHNGDAGPFRTNLEIDGWQVLNNDPNRRSDMHYIDAFPARGGKVYIDRWTDIHRVGNKVRLRKSDEAKAEFDAWRVGLIDSGKVPAPDPIIIEDIVETYREQYVQRLKSKRPTPLIEERLATHEAQLARMESASLEAPARKGKK